MFQNTLKQTQILIPTHKITELPRLESFTYLVIIFSRKRKTFTDNFRYRQAILNKDEKKLSQKTMELHFQGDYVPFGQSIFCL